MERDGQNGIVRTCQWFLVMGPATGDRGMSLYMLFKSSVVMREMVGTPSPDGEACPLVKLQLSVLSRPPSLFGGDCLIGFSVLLNAAGTYNGSNFGAIDTWRAKCVGTWKVCDDVGERFVGVLAPDFIGA
jgi:hypothetical protein